MSCPKIRLPIIELKIGNTNRKCLLDTGSTTSLLNKNLLPEFKITKLKKPIIFNTINANFCMEKEVITHLPNDFKEDNLVCWKLTNFDLKNG